VYESFVKPKNPITNYLTQYSGITEKLLKEVSTTVEDVQEALLTLLPADAIIVGHSLNFDLAAIKVLTVQIYFSCNESGRKYEGSSYFVDYASLRYRHECNFQFERKGTHEIQIIHIS